MGSEASYDVRAATNKPDHRADDRRPDDHVAHRGQIGRARPDPAQSARRASAPARAASTKLSSLPVAGANPFHQPLAQTARDDSTRCRRQSTHTPASGSAGKSAPMSDTNSPMKANAPICGAMCQTERYQQVAQEVERQHQQQHRRQSPQSRVPATGKSVLSAAAGGGTARRNAPNASTANGKTTQIEQRSQSEDVGDASQDAAICAPIQMPNGHAEDR